MDMIWSWVRNLIVLLVVGAFLGLVGFAAFLIVDEAEEAQWDRAQVLFAGVSAVALPAIGAILGFSAQVPSVRRAEATANREIERANAAEQAARTARAAHDGCERRLQDARVLLTRLSGELERAAANPAAAEADQQRRLVTEADAFLDRFREAEAEPPQTNS